MPIDTGNPLAAHYIVHPSQGGSYTIKDRIDGQIIGPAAVAAQVPSLTNSSAGQPVLRSNICRIHIPLKPANSSTFRWGFACWVKLSIATQVWILNIQNGTNDANLTRQGLFLSATAMDFQINSTSDVVGATYSSAFTNIQGQWKFIRYAFDGSQTTTTDRASIFLDEIKIVGAISALNGGSMPTRLRTATGNMSLFLKDNGTAAQGFQGDVGNQFFFFDDNVTPTQGLAYMNLSRPF